jgi:hypothetical protein
MSRRAVDSKRYLLILKRIRRAIFRNARPFSLRVREGLRESLANTGIREEDLRELAKVLRPARRH